MVPGKGLWGGVEGLWCLDQGCGEGLWDGGRGGAVVPGQGL